VIRKKARGVTERVVGSGALLGFWRQGMGGWKELTALLTSDGEPENSKPEWPKQQKREKGELGHHRKSTERSDAFDSLPRDVTYPNIEGDREPDHCV